MLDLFIQAANSPYAPWGVCFVLILWVGYRGNQRLQRMMFDRQELERRISILNSEIATLRQEMDIVTRTLATYGAIGRSLSELEKSLPWQELEKIIVKFVKEERARLGARAMIEQNPPPGRFGNLVDD